MRKLIGLSLCACCQDMAMGKVDPSHVKKIIARTSIRTSEHMEEVIASYQSLEWDDEPEHADEAGKIFRQMFAEGKVEQPRITHGRCPDFEHGAHWVTNKKKIKWIECAAARD